MRLRKARARNGSCGCLFAAILKPWPDPPFPNGSSRQPNQARDSRNCINEPASPRRYRPAKIAPFFEYGCRSQFAWRRVGLLVLPVIADVNLSCENLADDVSTDVGQAEIAAGVAIGQLLVVQAQQVQDRRVQIVDVDLVFDGVIAVFVGGAVAHARLHAAAGQPHREAVGVVVAAVVPLRPSACGRTRRPSRTSVSSSSPRAFRSFSKPAMAGRPGGLLGVPAFQSPCWSHGLLPLCVTWTNRTPRRRTAGPSGIAGRNCGVAGRRAVELGVSAVSPDRSCDLRRLGLHAIGQLERCDPGLRGRHRPACGPDARG